MLGIFGVLNEMVGRIVGMYGVVKSGRVTKLRAENPILGPRNDLNIVERGVIDNRGPNEFECS